MNTCSGSNEFTNTHCRKSNFLRSPYTIGLLIDDFGYPTLLGLADSASFCRAGRLRVSSRNDLSTYFWTILGHIDFFKEPLNNSLRCLKQKIPTPLAVKLGLHIHIFSEPSIYPYCG